MPTLTVIAGEATTRHVAESTTEQRGHVCALVKPDNTVLVHDVHGYQPVAWLTRPESVVVAEDRITAVDGDERLEVTVHESHGRAELEASTAGTPVGDCPDCGGRLVRSRGAVVCLGCESRYGLPREATVLETACDCGLPQCRVERGEPLSICLDRECESLDDRVRAAFDGVWDCPDCGSDLRVHRAPNLMIGCDAYPDCDVNYSFPVGRVVGECGCGLPVFETPTGRRCLDPDCGRGGPSAAEPPDSVDA
jgi:DNA topoisomerase-1